LIDLGFKPKYDKCDGPEMNTIKKKGMDLLMLRAIFYHALIVLMYVLHSFRLLSLFCKKKQKKTKVCL
jgi:hypothetical protein